MLAGEARVGHDAQTLGVQQVGWLDRPAHDLGDTSLRIANAGTQRMRVLLYAGKRQHSPLASYGPFIGETREDIARSIERYQSGVFLRV